MVTFYHKLTIIKLKTLYKLLIIGANSRGAKGA